MAKKFEQKFLEKHALEQKKIIWFVRATKRYEKAKEELFKAEGNLDFWKSTMTQQDLFIANCIINGYELGDEDKMKGF